MSYAPLVPQVGSGARVSEEPFGLRVARGVAAFVSGDFTDLLAAGFAATGLAATGLAATDFEALAGAFGLATDDFGAATALLAGAFAATFADALGGVLEGTLTPALFADFATVAALVAAGLPAFTDIALFFGSEALSDVIGAAGLPAVFLAIGALAVFSGTTFSGADLAAFAGAVFVNEALLFFAAVVVFAAVFGAGGFAGAGFAVALLIVALAIVVSCYLHGTPARRRLRVALFSKGASSAKFTAGRWTRPRPAARWNHSGYRHSGGRHVRFTRGELAM